MTVDASESVYAISPDLTLTSRKIGRLAVSFAGHDAVAAYLSSEIAHLPAATGIEQGQLSVVFAEPSIRPGEVQIGPYFIASDRVRVEDRLLRMTFETGESQTVTLASRPRPWRKRALGVVARLRDISYLDASGRVAKHFVYDFFNQLVQLRQLAVGQTWIHGSALTRGQRTVVLMAWGGVGKTSTMLQLVRYDGWRFLADDLTVIDESGCVYRSPQRIQIYAYNVAGDDGLRQRVLAGRGPVDKLHWHARRALLGADRVRRRMHAAELFGSDSVADQGRVTDAFFLRRLDCAAFRCRDISPEHAAALSTTVLHAELDPLCKMQTAIYSSDVPVDLPGIEEIHVEAQRIMTAAFSSSGARCRMIDVPTGAAPRDLRNYFSEILDE